MDRAPIYYYYHPPTDEPVIRQLQPRLAVPGIERETCRENYPLDAQTRRLLPNPGTNYFFISRTVFRQGHVHSEILDEYRKTEIDSKKKEYLNMFEKEVYILKYAMIHKIPVFGHMYLGMEGSVGHNIAYILRMDPETDPDAPPEETGRIEVILFETYDTKHGWQDLLIPYFLSLLNTDVPGFTETEKAFLKGLREGRLSGVVPTGINLQEGEVNGRCVMWSLIFLHYLKSVPLGILQTKNPTYFRYIYDDIKKKTLNDLMSIVYGASRASRAARASRASRKTRKNRINPTHNVQRSKSRKGISSFRRRIRGRFRHRSRRIQLR